MIQIVTATFEDGVLKPHEPLELPPHACVRVSIESLGESEEDLRRSAWQTVERLWAHSAIDSGGERMTRDQLHERR